MFFLTANDEDDINANNITNSSHGDLLCTKNMPQPEPGRKETARAVHSALTVISFSPLKEKTSVPSLLTVTLLTSRHQTSGSHSVSTRG